ncbi:hypothetical protein BZG36_02393 [Bifiguratus adelaidae]|uniref:DDHD domain-containing protein n=1 Tax=Bifiguratus adelaidae TaxID=1938954 RepID=A0A261Y1B3_9FUNG|nr:hypothetical protein BZG36_02393 [Bifiguratus adelaidae]
MTDGISGQQEAPHVKGAKVSVETLQKNTQELLQAQHPDHAFRVRFYPIEVDPALKLSSLRTVPNVRLMVNDWGGDVLLYFTPPYNQLILSTVVEQANKLYAKHCREHPEFQANSGKVHIIGCSLGGIIGYDVACGQWAFDADAPWEPTPANDNESPAPLHQAHESYDTTATSTASDDDPDPDLLSPLARRPVVQPSTSVASDISHVSTSSQSATPRQNSPAPSVTSIRSHNSDSASSATTIERPPAPPSRMSSGNSDVTLVPTSRQTDHPRKQHPWFSKIGTQIPSLDFPLHTVFMAGSPLAVTLVIRQQSFTTYHPPPPTRLINIFHPFDPLGYRLEPQVDDAFATIPPVSIPRIRGRRRLPPLSLPLRMLPTIPNLGIKDSIGSVMTRPVVLQARERFWRYLVLEKAGILGGDAASPPQVTVTHRKTTITVEERSVDLGFARPHVNRNNSLNDFSLPEPALHNLISEEEEPYESDQTDQTDASSQGKNNNLYGHQVSHRLTKSPAVKPESLKGIAEGHYSKPLKRTRSLKISHSEAALTPAMALTTMDLGKPHSQSVPPTPTRSRSPTTSRRSSTYSVEATGLSSRRPGILKMAGNVASAALNAIRKPSRSKVQDVTITGSLEEFPEVDPSLTGVKFVIPAPESETVTSPKDDGDSTSTISEDRMTERDHWSVNDTSSHLTDDTAMFAGEQSPKSNKRSPEGVFELLGDAGLMGISLGVEESEHRESAIGHRSADALRPLHNVRSYSQKSTSSLDTLFSTIATTPGLEGLVTAPSSPFFGAMSTPLTFEALAAEYADAELNLDDDLNLEDLEDLEDDTDDNQSIAGSMDSFTTAGGSDDPTLKQDYSAARASASPRASLNGQAKSSAMSPTTPVTPTKVVSPTGNTFPRIDHVLSEGVVDAYASEWIVALKSHFKYWGNRDLAAFLGSVMVETE